LKGALGFRHTGRVRVVRRVTIANHMVSVRTPERHFKTESSVARLPSLRRWWDRELRRSSKSAVSANSVNKKAAVFRGGEVISPNATGLNDGSPTQVR